MFDVEDSIKKLYGNSFVSGTKMYKPDKNWKEGILQGLKLSADAHYRSHPASFHYCSVSRMERPSELRSGEQHPLLKVDTGAGDVATHQPSSPTVCREIKKMLLDRWPG